LGGIIAVIGLQFQQEIDTQQGHIVGVVLILTGALFLIWGLMSNGGHNHSHEVGQQHEHSHKVGQQHEHSHKVGQQHEHSHEHTQSPSLLKRLTAIIVPFGVAASPDLTILPVALAASAIGIAAIVAVLSVFAAVTIATFIGLTLMATLVGYQIKGDWLEKHAMTITSLVLIAIGVGAFIGL
jgi:nickel/cobalt exporter